MRTQSDTITWTSACIDKFADRRARDGAEDSFQWSAWPCSFFSLTGRVCSVSMNHPCCSTGNVSGVSIGSTQCGWLNPKDFVTECLSMLGSVLTVETSSWKCYDMWYVLHVPIGWMEPTQTVGRDWNRNAELWRKKHRILATSLSVSAFGSSTRW